jgi:3-hydroxymyristoyl/3-hydroxydecanoyl-(acyl carrier protein) dehydratase
VTGWSLGANRLSAKFVFPPDMKCFDGHFPKFPVLAGVAQLYFIRHFARQAFSSFPDACVLRQLKFQKVIFPGTEVSLQIDKKSDDSWSFSLVGLRGPCASGIWERKNR